MQVPPSSQETYREPETTDFPAENREHANPYFPISFKNAAALENDFRVCAELLSSQNGQPVYDFIAGPTDL